MSVPLFLHPFLNISCGLSGAETYHGSTACYFPPSRFSRAFLQGSTTSRSLSWPLSAFRPTWHFQPPHLLTFLFRSAFFLSPRNDFFTPPGDLIFCLLASVLPYFSFSPRPYFFRRLRGPGESVSEESLTPPTPFFLCCLPFIPLPRFVSLSRLDHMQLSTSSPMLSRRATCRPPSDGPLLSTTPPWGVRFSSERLLLFGDPLFPHFARFFMSPVITV